MSTATQTPTAPLPAPAAAALARLGSAFPEALAEQYRIERAASGLRSGESTVINGTPVTAVSLEVAEAITRYEIAAERKAALEAKPTREWSGANFDSWAGCERTILDSVTTLALAGRTDLIDADVDPVIRTAADFRKAEARANELMAIGRTGRMSDLDADDLAHNVDLMAGYRATLKKVGRLDLLDLAAKTQRAVTRYGILMARVAELTMKDRLTSAEFDGLADAQAELDRLHEQLEQAGQLRLVSP